MASKAFLIAVAIVATVVAPTIAGELFLVGDERGWTLNFDYRIWAAQKEFHVGDSLLFRYPVGAHNVAKVNQTGFRSCTVPLSALPFTTGHDVITLTTPGLHWYICTIGSHCEIGPMKLVVFVLPASSESPSSPLAPSLAPDSTTTEERTGVFGLLGNFFGRLGH